jgi:ATP-dependent RNA helicase DeaD
MVSVEFNRFINYYKKTRDSIFNQVKDESDDREPREKTMVVQQDIL